MVESVGVLSRIWRFIRSAPLTYLWLIILAYTTAVAHDVNPHRLHHILVHRSTNLGHLDTNPITVLIESCCGSMAGPGCRTTCWCSPFFLVRARFRRPDAADRTAG